MWPLPVAAAGEFGHDPEQVCLVDDDETVETFAAQRADDALGDCTFGPAPVNSRPSRPRAGSTRHRK